MQAVDVDDDAIVRPDATVPLDLLGADHFRLGVLAVECEVELLGIPAAPGDRPLPRDFASVRETVDLRCDRPGVIVEQAVDLRWGIDLDRPDDLRLVGRRDSGPGLG